MHTYIHIYSHTYTCMYIYKHAYTHKRPPPHTKKTKTQKQTHAQTINFKTQQKSKKTLTFTFLGGEVEVRGLGRPTVLISHPDDGHVVGRDLQILEGEGHSVQVIQIPFFRFQRVCDALPVTSAKDHRPVLLQAHTAGETFTIVGISFTVISISIYVQIHAGLHPLYLYRYLFTSIS